jgi:energy-coupling factor transporter transmembrane protein EcfT
MGVLILALAMVLILQRFDITLIFFCFALVFFGLIKLANQPLNRLHSIKGFSLLLGGLILSVVVAQFIAGCFINRAPLQTACGTVQYVNSSAKKNRSHFSLLTQTDELHIEYQAHQKHWLQPEAEICIKYSFAPRWQYSPRLRQLK